VSAALQPRLPIVVAPGGSATTLMCLIGSLAVQTFQPLPVLSEQEVVSRVAERERRIARREDGFLIEIGEGRFAYIAEYRI